MKKRMRCFLCKRLIWPWQEYFSSLGGNSRGHPLHVECMNEHAMKLAHDREQRERRAAQKDEL